MAIKNSSVNVGFNAAGDGWSGKGGAVATQRQLTVTSGDITLTGGNAFTFNFPSASDTICGLAATQTLANKTITGLILSANTASVQSMLITKSAAIDVSTGLSDGMLWYNGTNLNFRAGTTTKDLLAGASGSRQVELVVAYAEESNTNITPTAMSKSWLIWNASNYGGSAKITAIKFVAMLKNTNSGGTGTFTANLDLYNSTSGATVTYNGGSTVTLASAAAAYGATASYVSLDISASNIGGSGLSALTSDTAMICRVYGNVAGVTSANCAWAKLIVTYSE